MVTISPYMMYHETKVPHVVIEDLVESPEI